MPYDFASAVRDLGLDLDAATLDKLLRVDNDSWRQEIPLVEAHYATIGERLPSELADQLSALEKRLSGS